MSEGQRIVLLRQMVEDLSEKTEIQVGDACRAWRRNGANRFFPTSGQLLDLMKNPYADPPNRYAAKFGGGCQCGACRNKTPREGFYRAPEASCREAAKVKDELAYWSEQQKPPSKLDEAEMHRRFLATQDLVRDHGMEWEAARAKVMIERTRELYPDWKIPELQTT